MEGVLGGIYERFRKGLRKEEAYEERVLGGKQDLLKEHNLYRNVMI